MRRRLSMLLGIALLTISTHAFALAPPVTLELNTIIESFSTFTVNNGNGSASIVPGTPLTIPYVYQGNQLVKLTVSSANSFQLRHTAFASHPTWYIPYSMTLDYGSGQVAVANNVARNLIDADGIYNLVKSMVISATAGTYPAGSYADTITFTIAAQ